MKESSEKSQVLWKGSSGCLESSLVGVVILGTSWWRVECAGLKMGKGGGGQVDDGGKTKVGKKLLGSILRVYKLSIFLFSIWLFIFLFFFFSIVGVLVRSSVVFRTQMGSTE